MPLAKHEDLCAFWDDVSEDQGVDGRGADDGRCGTGIDKCFFRYSVQVRDYRFNDSWCVGGLASSFAVGEAEWRAHQACKRKSKLLFKSASPAANLNSQPRQP